MQGIPHFFIHSHSVEDEVSAARFEKEALQIIDVQFQHHDAIVLTGGSGMFVDALCEGLDPIPASKELRDELIRDAENDLNVLLSELKQKDPEYYRKVDRNNPARLIRAIEVIRLTGKTYSSQRKAMPVKRPFNIHRFVIEHEREKLYERINLRVDLMMKDGLLDEVKRVLPFRQLTPLNTVGYKELFDYIDGKTTIDEAVELMKRNSRRYAKRQLTWLRRHPEAQWIPFDTTDLMIQNIFSKLPNALKLE